MTLPQQTALPEFTRPVSYNDLTMLKLAREIAMDIKPLEQILDMLGLSPASWAVIREDARFQGYLRRCVEEWEGAINTSERVKIKSLAFVEESLPEFFARAHDPKESLPAKTEILKTVARFANVGGSDFAGAGSGERLSVTINLGSDKQLRIERNITPSTIPHNDDLQEGFEDQEDIDMGGSW